MKCSQSGRVQVHCMLRFKSKRLKDDSLIPSLSAQGGLSVRQSIIQELIAVRLFTQHCRLDCVTSTEYYKNKTLFMTFVIVIHNEIQLAFTLSFTVNLYSSNNRKDVKVLHSAQISLDCPTLTASFFNTFALT